MRYTALVAGLLSLASSAVYARSTSHVENVQVENLRHVPEGWKEVGAPEQTRRLQFRIAVHQVSLTYIHGETTTSGALRST
jgi:tripeptidyl-peptidase-1